MLQAMAMRPEILASFATFGNAVYPGGLLERSLKEKVILRASILNECQFCTQSHISLMRHLSISNDPVHSVLDSELQSDREKIALKYTELVTGDSNRVTDEFFIELKLYFTEPEIVELTFLIGFINMLNRFNNAL
ncbi:MAG: carboxymuconolactone decarboxylase family protein, partial [Isosphaeraceae bacterium]